MAKAADMLKKEQKKAERERWQKQLARDLRALKITGYEEEFKFHTSRKWRFDFAFPGEKLAVEIDGGIWGDIGGHTSGAGYEKDREKDEAALLLDWIVYRVTPGMIAGGSVPATIERLRARRRELGIGLNN